MKLKILTANIAFGLKKMDNLFVNTVGHLVFHGWSMIALFLNPTSFKNRKKTLNPKRISYIKKHSSLVPILEIIRKENPDIVMLNELIKQIQCSEIEKELSALGFVSIYFGYSAHHDDATVCSLIASKLKGEGVAIKFTEGAHAGGGGGNVGLTYIENNITVVAVHMCIPKFHWLYDAQIGDLVSFVENERLLGREVIIGGDWNAPSQFIQNYQSFLNLNLKNSENNLPTCPTFFPKLQSLDHIFVPQNFKTINSKAIAFGSDHLAVCVEVEK